MIPSYIVFKNIRNQTYVNVMVDNRIQHDIIKKIAWNDFRGFSDRAFDETPAFLEQSKNMTDSTKQYFWGMINRKCLDYNL